MGRQRFWSALLVRIKNERHSASASGLINCASPQPAVSQDDSHQLSQLRGELALTGSGVSGKHVLAGIRLRNEPTQGQEWRTPQIGYEEWGRLLKAAGLLHETAVGYRHRLRRLGKLHGKNGDHWKTLQRSLSSQSWKLRGDPSWKTQELCHG